MLESPISNHDVVKTKMLTCQRSGRPYFCAVRQQVGLPEIWIWKNLLEWKWIRLLLWSLPLWVTPAPGTIWRISVTRLKLSKLSRGARPRLPLHMYKYVFVYLHICRHVHAYVRPYFWRRASAGWITRNMDLRHKTQDSRIQDSRFQDPRPKSQGFTLGLRSWIFGGIPLGVFDKVYLLRAAWQSVFPEGIFLF